jgi:hypothetical protein
MRFLKFLMNTEGDNGSGGGAAGDPPAATPPPAAMDMNKLMEQIGGMLDQKLTAFRAELAPQQQGGSNEPPPEDQSNNVDETVRQFVDARTGHVAGGMAVLADNMDAMQFNQTYGALLTPEEMKQVAAVHADWRNKKIGFMANGKPSSFSRSDVANHIFGAVTLQNRAKQQGTQGNSDAFLESQGRARPMGPGGNQPPVDDLPKDYKDMPYAKRAEFHKRKLDELQGGL